MHVGLHLEKYAGNINVLDPNCQNMLQTAHSLENNAKDN
jgi:hypothetical protein